MLCLCVKPDLIYLVVGTWRSRAVRWGMKLRLLVSSSRQVCLGKVWQGQGTRKSPLAKGFFTVAPGLLDPGLAILKYLPVCSGLEDASQSDGLGEMSHLNQTQTVSGVKVKHVNSSILKQNVISSLPNSSVAELSPGGMRNIFFLQYWGLNSWPCAY
jgi:hypothetical protein